MEGYMVQVTLGGQFEDLSVKARNVEQAIEKAKALVAKTEALRTFRHRFANYIV